MRKNFLHAIGSSKRQGQRIRYQRLLTPEPKIDRKKERKDYEKEFLTRYRPAKGKAKE